jgi:hypothetical protein
MSSKAFDNVQTLNAVINTIQKVNTVISVKDYGAKGDGVTNDTDAFALASAAINAADGGTLTIPPGLYIVGKQVFAGATGKGFAYGDPAGSFGAPSAINIKNCTLPVVIQGNGAVLKTASGLRFGAFDPVTGLAINPALPNFNQDLRGQLPVLINLENNKSVAVHDLELDGNINAMIIGGQWGDTGYQCSGGGVRAYLNDSLLLSNIYAHHHGLDGFEVSRVVTASTQPRYPHLITNCRSTYNGRQGLSWVAGNSLTVINSDFSHTGKNGLIASLPCAGIDIEPEGSIILGGTFINVRCFDNTGVGMVADVSGSKDCTFISCEFIGTTSWSFWCTQPRFRFENCLFVGSAVNAGGSTDPENASKYYGCRFVLDTSYSPSGIIFTGSPVTNRFELAQSQNVVYTDCIFFSASGYQLPFCAGGANSATFQNCYFEQVGTGTSFTKGQFTGKNTFVTGGTNDFSGSLVFGPVIVNGGEYKTIILPETETLKFRANNNVSGGKQVRWVSHYDPTVWAAAVGGAIVGDVVLDPSPTAGGNIGSVCTTAGNPGTWKTFGAISA